ncbi:MULTISPECIES: hypothetical protein [unclassified Rhodococcus (in: high G+C Gram-positive bacteria)]|uniref:hypothetical protein n=1 Tax=unclassified Rhodococcus (in: high G+C Gram-positive bacteria) TaxID=192944 RepID=UPI0033935C9D
MAGRVSRGRSAGRVTAPPELAAGPSIPVWADAEVLAQLAMITEAHPEWHERYGAAMLSARGAWTRAVARWASDADLDRLTAHRAVTHCRPFWP